MNARQIKSDINVCIHLPSRPVASAVLKCPKGSDLEIGICPFLLRHGGLAAENGTYYKRRLRSNQVE